MNEIKSCLVTPRHHAISYKIRRRIISDSPGYQKKPYKSKTNITYNAIKYSVFCIALIHNFSFSNGCSSRPTPPPPPPPPKPKPVIPTAITKVNPITESKQSSTVSFITRSTIGLRINHQIARQGGYKIGPPLSIKQSLPVDPVTIPRISTTPGTTVAPTTEMAIRTNEMIFGTTSRPNVTFYTDSCPPMYSSWYCLNGATCFIIKIGQHTLYNCECAEGYMGPRCEFKDLDSSYLLSRKQVLFETASIAFGATLAILLVVIVCASLYIRYNQNDKCKAQDRRYNRIEEVKTKSPFQMKSSATFGYFNFPSVNNSYVTLNVNHAYIIACVCSIFTLLIILHFTYIVFLIDVTVADCP